MNIHDKFFLTFDEAAELCGVSKTTIERLVRLGEIRKTKIGKLARIDREDLEAWRRDLAGTVQVAGSVPPLKGQPEVIEKRVRTR